MKEKPTASSQEQYVFINHESNLRIFCSIFAQILLSWPIICPKDIYDLMCECWKCNPNDRPTFKEIHMFLMRKNLGIEKIDVVLF